MWFWHITVILLMTTSAYALIGYHCNANSMNISTISLKEVGRCPPVETTYNSTTVAVQILQQQRVKQQKVYSCLVEVLRNVYHCGMHSHISAVQQGLSEYIHPLGLEECRAVHRFKTMKFFNTVITGLLANGTTNHDLTIIGRLTTNGDCKGASFSDNNLVWDNVVVQATIKVTLQDYHALVRSETNEISLKGGYVCPYLKSYCFDTMYGESFWETSDSNSCKEFSLLYKGNATKITNIHNGNIYYVVELEQKVFALTYVKITAICNVILIQTEHPKILVYEGQHLLLDSTTELLSADVNLLIYVNSKFLYVEQAYKRDIDKLYTDTIQRRCEMQREILRNKLLLASVSSSNAGWILNQVEGQFSRVFGEVLYLLTCEPVPVQFRRPSKCYLEFPILHNNLSKFMAPLTHIIQDHGTEIECSPLTPSLYYVQEKWWGFSPTPVESEAPMELQPEREQSLEFSPIKPLGSEGIYTMQEIENSHRNLLFGQERSVVENIVARKMSGHETDSQGFYTTNLFNEAELKTLAKSTMKQIYGWFTDIGIFCSGMIGFYYIYLLIKYFLNVTLNGLHIYKTLGCGFSLLASLWNTLAFWVIHNNYFNAKMKEDTTETTNTEDMVQFTKQPPLDTNADPNEIGVASTQPPQLYPPIVTKQPHWTRPQP